MVFVQLLAFLVVILIAAEVFTNALEHLGEKLGISEGVTGSIFAAVGTALPETLVPILAIFAGTANIQANHEIGVGAILGAPLMLSTLSISLMAMSVWKRRGTSGHLRPERTGLTRDLNYFIAAFALATAALFLPLDNALVRTVLGIGMIMIYVVYVWQTIAASSDLVDDGHATEADGDIFLSKLGLPNNMPVIIVQLLVGLGLLVLGAKGFINGVEEASALLGISTLMLSLLIIPIATELPEKVNSILWIRKGKDTLAFGNITGAMVFQGTLLPAIGILANIWHNQAGVLSGIIITLIGALWIRFLMARGDIRVWHLLVNFALYVTYLVIALN
jgi:cation:H+ antiporter